MMMDKDSVLINDNELEAVSGGVVDLALFFSMDTRSDAQRYLVSNGYNPNTDGFKAYMEKWEARHK